MKTNRNLSIFIVAAIAALPLTGCLSDDEKKARRAWAFDIAGEYDEARDAEGAGGEVEIINEQDKVDVRVVFRRGELYEGEQAWLDLIADDDRRAEVAAEIVLGEGLNSIEYDLVGGENISDDFGKSSTVTVSGPKIDVTPKSDDATDGKLHYMLKATIDNGSAELRGTLSLHYSDRRPDGDTEDDDDTELHIETESFDIVLERRDGPLEAPLCDDCTTGGSLPDEDASEGDVEADEADEAA